MYQKFLVIVPGGKSKIWKRCHSCGPTKARDAYTSGPFLTNRAFAEKFADRWVILSTKYGFVNPDFIIPGNYNAVFSRQTTNAIKLADLKQQTKEKRLEGYDIIVALGGEEYVRVVREAFDESRKVIAPTRGLSAEKAMSRVRSLFIYDKKDLAMALTGVISEVS